VINRDYPVVFATLYIFALLGLFVNLVSDFIYTLVDPRIDFESRRCDAREHQRQTRPPDRRESARSCRSERSPQSARQSDRAHVRSRRAWSGSCTDRADRPPLPTRLWLAGGGFALSPLNRRRWRNFKANRRGYWSLWIFLALFVLSLFAEVIANDKPIVASYKGELLFPVLVDYPESKFGGFLAVTDYKDPVILG
jgi:hypothetical protein